MTTQPGMQIRKAATAGCRWLLELQNRDSGWPTFCRGWGTQPFDRSGADITAHVLRGLNAWTETLPSRGDDKMLNGFYYMIFQQTPQNSWLPLWFGNQDDPAEENPIYGTVKVLTAIHALGMKCYPQLDQGKAWLRLQQNPDGGFGGGKAVQEVTDDRYESSVEETALAIEGLLCDNKGIENCPELEKSLDWLCRRVEENSHIDCSPIGFYFSKLWYYEKLYPRIMTVSALAHACRAVGPMTPLPTPP